MCSNMSVGAPADAQGKGPRTVPTLPYLQQVPADVDLTTTDTVRQGVVAFLQELQAADADATASALDVSTLQQAHPADVVSHAAHLDRCASAPGTHL